MKTKTTMVDSESSLTGKLSIKFGNDKLIRFLISDCIDTLRDFKSYQEIKDFGIKPKISLEDYNENSLIGLTFLKDLYDSCYKEFWRRLEFIEKYLRKCGYLYVFEKNNFRINIFKKFKNEKHKIKIINKIFNKEYPEVLKKFIKEKDNGK